MKEPAETGAAESEQLIPAAVKGESSLIAALNTLEISQDVAVTVCAASEEKDGRQTKQEDGLTVCPPAGDSCTTGSKWAVGAQCQAVWSEDGWVYPATVVSLDGERCRVRFNGYGNEEDVELSVLSPEAAPQTQKDTQDWKVGSRCRVVYSEDGLVYPAVVLWVRGRRCCVRFDDYNNEEEHDLSSLLTPDELHGPSRAAAAKSSTWRSNINSSNFDWKRRRREEKHRERRGEERGGPGGESRREEERRDQGGERRGKEERREPGAERRREERGDPGGERRREEIRGERGGARREEQVKDRPSNQSKVEKETEEKKKRRNQQRDEADKPTSHSFSVFPPFPPPPPHTSSGDPVSFIPPPPPPPLWMFGESGSSAGANATSSMLMLWYMCGFHTGSYMAQQLFRSNSKD